MKILSALLMSISCNQDTLSTSLFYKKKSIFIPKSSSIIIAIITTFITFISMLLGKFICIVFKDDVCNIFGGVLIIFTGVYFFVEYVRIKRSNEGYDTSYYVEPSSKFKKILENPLSIDNDNSHYIDLKKALTLSISLSLNNMNISFAYSITKGNLELMLLFNFLITIIFLYISPLLFNKSISKFILQYEKIIAGIILIISGLLEMFIL